jgi:hypothetical protein
MMDSCVSVNVFMLSLACQLANAQTDALPPSTLTAHHAGAQLGPLRGGLASPSHARIMQTLAIGCLCDSRGSSLPAAASDVLSSGSGVLGIEQSQQRRHPA